MGCNGVKNAASMNEMMIKNKDSLVYKMNDSIHDDDCFKVQRFVLKFEVFFLS